MIRFAHKRKKYKEITISQKTGLSFSPNHFLVDMCKEIDIFIEPEASVYLASVC